MLKRIYNGGFQSRFTSFHSLKSFIFYSTSVTSKDGDTTPPILEYLVKSVGFSENEALAVLTKVSTSSLSTKKSELVVEFLKENGFDGTHIRKVIYWFPDVLRNNVNTTLKPKIRAFQNVGFSGSDLGLIISRYPSVLNRGVKSHIVPVLELWKSVFGKNEQLVRMMLQTKSPRLLSPDALKYLPATILLLKNYGVTSDGLKMLMKRRSFLFYSTQWVEKLLTEVEEKLGIPRTSTMFVYGICALTKKCEVKIQSWIEVFRSHGWSETEISELLRRHPMSLSLNEKSLGLKLRYFMEDLGYGSDYLSTHPVTLSYSMEKRVVPRVAVIETLKERHLLKRSIESRFLKKYVLPCREILPELFENYTRVTGYTDNAGIQWSLRYSFEL
ncbi:hypothetical protein V2J09_012203 [Rumex salicifolius]